MGAAPHATPSARVDCRQRPMPLARWRLPAAACAAATRRCGRHGRDALRGTGASATSGAAARETEGLQRRGAARTAAAVGQGCGARRAQPQGTAAIASRAQPYEKAMKGCLYRHRLINFGFRPGCMYRHAAARHGHSIRLQTLSMATGSAAPIPCGGAMADKPAQPQGDIRGVAWLR